MASNFTKRLDRLERLIREKTLPDTAPLYLREGTPIPEDINPERVVFVVRAFVDPPERDAEQLPEMELISSVPADEVRVKGFNGPLEWPTMICNHKDNGGFLRFIQLCKPI